MILKSHWIKVQSRLPDLDKSVLGVMKAECDCEHYCQVVIYREETENGDWEWKLNDNIKVDKDKIMAWQRLPKLPKGATPAYRE